MKKLKNMLFLLTHAWQTSKSQCITTAANSIFRAFIPLVNILGLGIVLNALLTDAPRGQVLRLIIVFLSINLSITIVREILYLIDLNIMRVTSNVMQFDFSRDSVNINYHYAQDGTILNLRQKSMTAHPSVYLGRIGELINYIVQYIGIISVLLILSPVFLLLIAATSSISIVLIFKLRKNDFEFRNKRVDEDRRINYLYQVMTEYKFAKEVRINNAKDYVANKYANMLWAQINKLKTLYTKSTKINLVNAVIAVGQTALMYFYFSYQVFYGHISIAEYTVLLGTATLLASIMLGFFDNIAQLGRTCEAVAFYHEYKNLVEAQSNIVASNKLDKKDINFSDSIIKFENVSFSYPNTGIDVLKNINVEIRKGDKIGIVGLNGSGKTTFVKLLTRIYDPTDGKIAINGIDIKEIPYHQYIEHIGVVLQDFLLFAYSVKENIVLDRAYDEAKLTSSINKSGLRDKIDGLKQGVETSVNKVLDNNGVEFSGGEGQKLALARAIYKDAATLILDEPTSALDPIAEYELFSKLDDISEDKAAIYITHRLSSTKFCDKIIVLSSGEIVELGNHNKLINQSGLYAELFNAQARYYKDLSLDYS